MIFSYRILGYTVIALCLVTIYSLFTIKDRVMTLKCELKEVKKQIDTEEDTIRILKAELTYLSSPKRIKELSDKYLVLETPKITQVIIDPLFAKESQKTDILLSSKNTVRRPTAKWRYKKGPKKYLTMIKGKK